MNVLHSRPGGKEERVVSSVDGSLDYAMALDDVTVALKLDRQTVDRTMRSCRRSAARAVADSRTRASGAGETSTPTGSLALRERALKW